MTRAELADIARLVRRDPRAAYHRLVAAANAPLDGYACVLCGAERVTLAELEVHGKLIHDVDLTNNYKEETPCR